VAPGSGSSKRPGFITLSGYPGAAISPVRLATAKAEKRAGELLEELERAIEAELAEARAKLAKLMKGAVAGYVRRTYLKCGKGCHKCPHGPYSQFKEPGGNWRNISEDEYARLLVATQRWREARRVERQVERAERLWLRARELLDEVLGILGTINGGDEYEE